MLPGALAADEDPVMKIGLYFGTDVLASANLANEVGGGYRFGYFDSSRNFVELGRTAVGKISMLKDKVMYLSDGVYMIPRFLRIRLRSGAITWIPDRHSVRLIRQRLMQKRYPQQDGLRFPRILGEFTG